MQRLRTIQLFSGAGGGLLADLLLGHHPICAVEINQHCQKILSARQREGQLPWFPIFDDITQFDGRPWYGLADILAAGFPCQDLSSSGSGSGLDGERSGLYFQVERLIGEIRPRRVLLENSPNLVHNGLERVLLGLASLGYDARWGIVGANAAGADHARERFWLVADAIGFGQSGSREYQQSIHPKKDAYREASELVRAFREGSMPFVCRGHDGLAGELDFPKERLTALGNGQAPDAAALAWRLLA